LPQSCCASCSGCISRFARRPAGFLCLWLSLLLLLHARFS
jgi:hypothetical protein